MSGVTGMNRGNQVTTTFGGKLRMLDTITRNPDGTAVDWNAVISAMMTGNGGDMASYSGSAYGAAIPVKGFAQGFTDGASLRPGWVYPQGSEWLQGVSIRLPGVNGSVAGGTSDNPFNVAGTVGISGNVHAVLDSMPLPSGASTAQKQQDIIDLLTQIKTGQGNISGSHVIVDGPVSVDGTFWPTTQPVSALALPLPNGAATETTLNTIKNNQATSTKQDVMIARLETLIGNLGTVLTDLAGTLSVNVSNGVSVTGSTVSIAGTIPVSGTFFPPVQTTSVNNFPTSFNIGNFPATQAISGSVTVSNFPSVFNIGNLPATQAVSGAVSVSNFPTSFNVGNFPSSQAVTAAALTDGTQKTKITSAPKAHTLSSVTVNTTSGLLWTAATVGNVWIQNPSSTANLYLHSNNGTAVTTGGCIKVPPLWLVGFGDGCMLPAPTANINAISDNGTVTGVTVITVPVS